MEEKKTPIGSIIGIIIIIALIVLGGLYFWGKRIEESKNTKELTTDTTQPLSSEDNEASIIKSTNSSDDLDSIEADLKATNTSNLDLELDVQSQ